MHMFRKTAVFEYFDLIRSFPVAESGQNCQKTHLQTKPFHMSIFPGLYDHPLQRNSLEKHMFRKTADFGHFGPFRPNLAETVKKHIYRPRPFIWAYSQVSTTIRYKDQCCHSLSEEKKYKKKYKKKYLKKKKYKKKYFSGQKNFGSCLRRSHWKAIYRIIFYSKSLFFFGIQ